MFLWDFGDGSTSGSTNPVHGYSSGGDYTVILDVSNAYGCNSSLTDVLNVDPIPDASFNVFS